MKTDNLPEWAKYDKRNDIIIVDPEVVYPLYLKKLGYELSKLTQNMLECARRCFTEDLKTIVGGSLHLRIEKSKKETFKLVKYSLGKPINWRSEYKRISGQK